MEPCKNVIIFVFDNSPSVYIGGRNKNILVLGERSTQVLDNAAIIAEAKYLINLTELGTWFVLNLYHNGSNSFPLVHAVKMNQFKAKD